MDEKELKEFKQKAKELEERFKKDTDLLLNEYRKEIKEITKGIENRRMAQLKKELGS